MKKLILLSFLLLLGCQKVELPDVKPINQDLIIKEEKQETILGHWKIYSIRDNKKELTYTELKGKINENDYKNLNMELIFNEENKVTFKVDNEEIVTTDYFEIDKTTYKDKFSKFTMVINKEKLEIKKDNSTLIFKKVVI